MICFVKYCWGFAKRCYKRPAMGGSPMVIHACADHWPKVVG